MQLSHKQHFLSIYRRDNPRKMFGEHEKKFVNHEPEMSDLQTFRAFSNVSIFYEITGAINDNFLTQQGSRNMSVIS